jgi:hypothetical protein
MLDMPYMTWCDAHIPDTDEYWNVQRRFATETAAENYLKVLQKDPRYTASDDACSGILFPLGDNNE